MITQTLWCKLPSTPEEQKKAFRESLNAVNGKVSLEQAKDLYHSLGRIKDIKSDSEDRRLKASEIENVLKNIGIDPEAAAESAKGAILPRLTQRTP